MNKTIPHTQAALPPYAYIVLVVMIFAASAGPITIRQTQLVGVPSLVIIAARLVLASVVLAPFAWKEEPKMWRKLRRKEWLLLAAAGLLFALNLLLLFLALEYTSVLVTSVLRRTSPLWVIWLEILFLGGLFTRKVWVGLLLTMAGSVLVAWGSGGAIMAGSRPVFGATLALVGSVSIGLYLLIGRVFHTRLATIAYSWLVFTVAAVVTLVVTLFMGIPFVGYGLIGYVWIVITTIISQFLGHIPLNICLRYFSATKVSVFMQLGVVGSAVLAFFSFHEMPSLWQIVGSGTILLGVSLVSWC